MLAETALNYRGSVARLTTRKRDRYVRAASRDSTATRVRLSNNRPASRVISDSAETRASLRRLLTTTQDRCFTDTFVRREQRAEQSYPAAAKRICPPLLFARAGLFSRGVYIRAGLRRGSGGNSRAQLPPLALFPICFCLATERDAAKRMSGVVCARGGPANRCFGQRERERDPASHMASMSAKL